MDAGAILEVKQNLGKREEAWQVLTCTKEGSKEEQFGREQAEFGFSWAEFQVQPWGDA